MFRSTVWKFVIVVVVLLTAMSAFASVQAADTLNAQSEPAYDWLVPGSSDDPLEDGSRVALQNLTIDSCLVHKVRPFGINLGWNDDCTPNIRFYHQSSDDELHYGERLAIRVGGSYIRYEKRRFGINLVWSRDPVYEWEIRGGETGEVIHKGIAFALFNHVEDDYVIYCVRPFGINLRWLDDCGSASNGGSSTGQVLLSMRMGPFTSPTEQGCTGQITWTLTPGTLTGSSGTSTVVTIDRDYEVPLQLVGPNAWYCFVHDIAGNLRLGTWSVRATMPTWAASCELRVRGGNNLAHFTQFRNGCVNGFGYPGD